MSLLESRFSTVLLVAGIAAGAFLAAAGILERGPEATSTVAEDEVARVGQQPIRRPEYERVVGAVESERREPLDEAGRRHVLDRLIDEELLIQRGVELGLAQRDPRLRAELSAAVIGLLVAQAEVDVAEPDREALISFYEEHADLFRGAPRFRIDNLFIAVVGADDDAAGRARAEDLARRLGAGDALAALRAAADALVAAPPDDWILADTIQEYLGPSVALAVAALEEGGVTAPIRSFGGYHIVRLVARRGGQRRPFEDVAAEVREAYRRRAGDRAVEAFLEERRQIVPIVIAPELR